MTRTTECVQSVLKEGVVVGLLHRMPGLQPVQLVRCQRPTYARCHAQRSRREIVPGLDQIGQEASPAPAGSPVPPQRMRVNMFQTRLVLIVNQRDRTFSPYRRIARPQRQARRDLADKLCVAGARWRNLDHVQQQHTTILRCDGRGGPRQKRRTPSKLHVLPTPTGRSDDGQEPRRAPSHHLMNRSTNRNYSTTAARSASAAASLRSAISSSSASSSVVNSMVNPSLVAVRSFRRPPEDRPSTSAASKWRHCRCCHLLSSYDSSDGVSLPRNS